jgi:DNA-binding transcriptional MocR family regulator
MRRSIVRMGGPILMIGILLWVVTGVGAAPVELNVWSAFPELHDQVTWIAGKYMEKYPNIKIKTTLFPQRALEEKVAVVPGSAFGVCGEGYVRCCYATSLADIEEALNRMKRFVEKYQIK